VTDLEFFRHTLATIAYRAGKCIRNAPESFANFKAGASSKTPVEILAHMSDLLDWSLVVVKGGIEWKETAPVDWTSEVARFYRSLKQLDDYLASGSPIHGDLPRLFQGPIAGAIVYLGRLDTLRRRSGSPTQREIYFDADIVIGRVGLEQSSVKTLL
jgi:hypothetical protein